MATPTIHSTTTPAAGLAATSNANTAIGDLVVVFTWERAGAGVPTHTLQSGFTEIWSQGHNDGSTDGRLSVAYKVATASGAQSYQAYTSDNGTETWTGLLVIDAGTYGLPIPATGVTSTGTGAPNPPQLTGLNVAKDYLICAISAWHLSASQTLTPTHATYTLQTHVAGAATGDVAVATLGVTGVTSEDPGAYGDNQTPNGTSSITLAIPNPFTAGEIANKTQASAAASGTTIACPSCANAAGDLLVALVAWGTSDRTPTISDTRGNTWTEIGTHFWMGGGTLLGHAMFYAKNSIGGGALNTITADYGGTCTERSIQIIEVAGLDVTDPLEGTVGQGSQTSGGGADNATSTARTPGEDNCLLVGGCAILVASPTMAAGTGWTEQLESAVLSSIVVAGMESLLQTTAGSQAATWTIPTSASYHARVAAFRPASSTTPKSVSDTVSLSENAARRAGRTAGETVGATETQAKQAGKILHGPRRLGP